MPVATPKATLFAPCPDFTLDDVYGKPHRRDDVVTGAASLVVFFCNHCPYAKAVEDRVVALAHELKPRGLSTTFIAANDFDTYKDDAPPKLRERAEQKGYGVPYLVDVTQQVARDFDAACTPDFFVFDRDRVLVYRGRLDDNWKRPEAVKQRELFTAIETVLAGGRPPLPHHPSLGCSIKWRDG